MALEWIDQTYSVSTRSENFRKPAVFGRFQKLYK